MMHNKAQSMRRQSGLTLVELMVALAIGSFLIIGAVQIYNQSRQAFVVNESIARVQETDGHHADDALETVLLRWLRGAGPRALAGMAESGPGPFVRPLLASRIARTLLTARRRMAVDGIRLAPRPPRHGAKAGRRANLNAPLGPTTGH